MPTHMRARQFLRAMRPDLGKPQIGIERTVLVPGRAHLRRLAQAMVLEKHQREMPEYGDEIAGCIAPSLTFDEIENNEDPAGLERVFAFFEHGRQR